MATKLPTGTNLSVHAGGSVRPSKLRRMTSMAVAAAVLACAGSVGSALGADAPPTTPDPYAFHIGRFDAFALQDAADAMLNDAKVFGVDVGAPAVAGVLRAAGAPTDKIALSVDALLVKAPGRVMLFDTGLGPKAHGALMAGLAKIGVAPDDVTDVFITHSHGDHVGGLLTADGQPAFPKADIHIAALEWRWMQEQKDSKATVAAISSRTHPFQPGVEVAPGVTSVALLGHTPGHVGYEIASDGQKLLDIGDLAHSSIVSLAKPEWRVAFDDAPADAIAVRKATLAQLADSHTRVFAPHFPFPGVGYVSRKPPGFAWTGERRPAAAAARRQPAK